MAGFSVALPAMDENWRLDKALIELLKAQEGEISNETI